MGKWAVLAWSGILAVYGQPRVLFVSIDGLGYKNLTGSPAARELTVLHRLARHGVLAPLQTSYPSKTSAGHAALFTGAWSGVNGIFSNTNPIAPRSEHALAESISGFRSESLTAEPIWTAVARQGASAVAYQATQLYPFTALSAGLGESNPPAVVNGYQSRMLAPHRVIRQKDVQEIQAGVYSWTDGPLRFRLERLPDGLRVSSSSGSGGDAALVVKMAPLETGPPRKRPLARHFSEVLPVQAEGIRTGVYLRLFEYSPTDFLLFRTSAQELASSGVTFDLQALEGAFVGNSATQPYERGLLGKRIGQGGDGVAERRYLETVELVVRQLTRHTLRLDERLRPRLLVGYYPVIDDIEHLWFGISPQGITGIDPYRAWGYAALDEGLKPLVNRFRKDAVLFSSDHGMAGNTHEIRMGSLLAELGFAKDSVVPNASCLFVNTVDWKRGIVPLAEREGLVDSLEGKLKAQGLFSAFRRQPELSERFGLRGAVAPDLCFDVKAGYYPSDSTRSPAILAYPLAQGEHGFDPMRADMQSYLLASGRGIRRLGGASKTVFRAIDVSPTACALLGLHGPAQAKGRVLQEILNTRR
jgi:hypothetical protein